MSHTMTTRTQHVKMNGAYLSEFELYSLCAVREGVPTVFLSGDAAICERGKELYPWLVTAAVKEGRGDSVICKAPKRALREIYEGVKEALSRDLTAITLPAFANRYEVEIEYKEHTEAARMSYFPGMERTGSHTVRFVTKDFYEAVRTLNRLAGILKENERKNGAIDFDRPEMKVEVDEKGKPLRVYQKISKEANWLIEEFMLLANRTVAEYVATGGQMNGVAQKNAKTFVYRIHGEPNELKLENFYTFAKGFGYRIPTEAPTGGRAAAKSLTTLLDAAKGKPESAAMENLALRAMAKACYSTDNIGHYGLAFKFYTHFTSPIRRYPDLMVHRLLALYLDGAESRKKDKFEEECRYASERELVAADAERTSIKYKLVEFMMDKIGQEFDGHVSGITEWGMYVEIEPTKIEGMVSLRDIRSDFFEFDEPRYRLVGKRSHKIFRLGDAVRIRVLNANLEQRILDYELIEHQQ